MIHRRYNWIPERKSNTNEANLRLRIKWNNSKNIISISLGCSIDLDKWSNESQRCKANSTHGLNKIPAIEINKRINYYESLADDIFIKFDQKNIIPTKEELKNALNIALGKQSSNNSELVSPLYSKYIQEQSQRNSWSVGTIIRYSTTAKHIKEFNPQLKVSDLNDDTFQDLQRYLHRKGLRNSTIIYTFSNIKTFLHYLKSKGIFTDDLQCVYKPKLKIEKNKGAVVYLTWEELISVYNLELKGTKEHIRDVFCFSCFTSLRYSDIKKLQRFDIKENHIEVVTQKTYDSLKIELNKYSRAILDKYKNINFPNNNALPVYSNQFMNVMLKRICKKANINDSVRCVHYEGAERIERILPKHEIISMHCGRRTFVVNALYLGIPADVIIKWTGHHDYSAMKPYIAIVDNLKEKEMDKFNQK